MKNLIKLFEIYKFFNSKFTKFVRKTELKEQVNNLIEDLAKPDLTEATLKALMKRT